MGIVVHIRRNDIVIARAGTPASGGKTGKVLQVFPGRGRAIVEGLNYIHKTLRKSQDNPKGGIIQKEASISVSNLMLFCPHCKKGVRVSRVLNEQGKRLRKCGKCGHQFDR